MRPAGRSSRGYIAVLRTNGAARAFVPAIVGRLSFAMVTLVLLLSVHSATGSFAIAGAATGLFGLVNVVASPYRARLVDRFGQFRTLTALALLFAAALAAMAVALTHSGTPAWLLVVVAAAAGIFPPPLGASMRELWRDLMPDSASRAQAYSVDAVSEELLFTVAPLVAVAVVGTAEPAVALLVVGGLAVAGTLGLTTSSASRVHVAVSVPRNKAARPLRQPGFSAVLVALVGVGVVLGTVEVAVPAAADRGGSVGLTGVLLAAFAAGSAAGGLLYGRRTWGSSLLRRLLILGVLMTLLSAALPAAPNTVALGLGLAAVGFFLAPSLVTGYLLADDLTASEVRTEASSWINTAVNAGAALAAVGIGSVVDRNTPDSGFVVGAVVALGLLAIAAFVLRTSSRD